MINWSTIGKVACGFVLGTAGVKLLSSKDAKKCYTHVTAAAYRCKDTCLETYTNIKGTVRISALMLKRSTRKDMLMKGQKK